MKKAIIAVSRKLVTNLPAMGKSGTAYWAKAHFPTCAAEVAGACTANRPFPADRPDDARYSTAIRVFRVTV